MADSPKKDRWSALADLFGLASSGKPIPEAAPEPPPAVVPEPAPVAEAPPPPASTPIAAAPVAPVTPPPAPKPRSKWDMLAGALGLPVSNQEEAPAAAVAPPPKPAAPPAPKPAAPAPQARGPAPSRPERPAVTPPAAAPVVAPPAATPVADRGGARPRRNFAAEILGEDPPAAPKGPDPLAELFQPKMPKEEPAPKAPIDDLGDDSDRPLESDFDSDQPRRRRRRRRRGRGGEGETTEVRRDEAPEPGGESRAESAPPRKSFDDYEDDDAPRYELDEIDEPKAEADSPPPRERSRERDRGERGDAAGGEERTGRRRRRGRGRGGPRTGAESSRREPRAEELDELDDLPLPKIEGEDEFDDDDLESDIVSGEEGSGEEGAHAHKRIPGWLETIDVLIQANMANRDARGDSGRWRGGGRGGRGGGRGGRGRGGGGDRRPRPST